MQTELTVDDGLRDIKPPVEIPTGWEWLWWVAAILALAALIVVLWRWWRGKKSFVAPAPAVPPHVRARQKLERALQIISQPEPFTVAVSDAIRVYLEQRFQLRAPERTTEEFLHDLQSTGLLAPDQKQSLGGFLSQCDLVKFARYEPTESELRQLHSAAGRLIDETEAPAIEARPSTSDLAKA